VSFSLLQGFPRSFPWVLPPPAVGLAGIFLKDGEHMGRPKTEFRNEIKTRVRDTTFDAVHRYMRDNRCASEARAISDLLEIALFGVIGSVPPELVGSSHESAQFGPKTQA